MSTSTTSTTIYGNHWGPPLWDIFHRLALRVNQDRRETLVNFYKIIPCTYCANEFKQYIDTYPMPADDQDVFAWTVMLHNKVNIRLNRPEFLLEDAIMRYSNGDWDTE